MNLFLKKAAAFLAAGLIATAGLGVESFAESAKLTGSYVDLRLNAAVAKPTFTVKGSAGVRKVRLSTATAGATIYYTTNGAVPTTKSKVYSGTLIRLTADTKIRAIAVKNGVSSAVMNKTFYIKTKYGDVTGDNQINSNDYSRLKNYIDGKTKYICTDNADCNGSGGISKADLTVLSQYLAGTITSLPAKVSSTVKKPEASMRKIYGGMQITLTPKTAGSEIYYTTNGSAPTTLSTRYTGPFQVTSTSAIRAAAYLNGEMSGTLSFTASVGTLSDVQADKSTTTSYTGDISVTLYNSNSSARILYTTDGSDPRTSLTASVYYSPIKISKTTTLKAYAQAKSYADSAVSTFNYNVESVYTISGTVWDDSPGKAGATWDEKAIISSNGVMASSEAGVSGIPVYLISSSTAAQDAPAYYIQKTTTDFYGKYSFTNLSKNTSYKVVFEYNSQKYRAYNSVVSGGNQALAYKTIDTLTIRSNGAYAVTTGNNESFQNSLSKYSDAVNSSYYKMYAITPKTYTESADDVNFALVSKNYGVLDVSVSVSGYDTTNNTVSNGKKLVYIVKVTNNSPMQLTTLNACVIDIQMTNAFGGSLTNQSLTTTGSINQSFLNNGDMRVLWSDFVGSSGLAPGKSAELYLECYVDYDPGLAIDFYAQVYSYRFGTSCYDYYSAPGNMTAGTPKERDEAKATTITVAGGSSSSTTKKLEVSENTATISSYGSYTYEFYILNGTSIDDLYISTDDTTAATYETSSKKVGDLVIVKLTVHGVKTGTSKITVTLKEDTKQSATFRTNVT
jgi:hypothetical protein